MASGEVHILRLSKIICTPVKNCKYDLRSSPFAPHYALAWIIAYTESVKLFESER